MSPKVYFIILISLWSFSFVKGQEKKDSIYYKIEKFSDKRKVTKFLHRFVFRRVADSVSVVNVPQNIRSTDEYQGKYIRNISITTIDPFGYSNSSEKVRTRWYDRLVDNLHMQTKNKTVKNYLLFKEGEEYNAQKLYESERLLRSMNFVNRVSINVDKENITQDSIDISVKVLDSWSLRPVFSFSGSQVGFGLAEENFLGLGDEIDVLYKADSRTPYDYYMAQYIANNIFGTYVNAQILGERDFFKNERINFSLSRKFFSPLTRWAGGINFEYFLRRVLLPIENVEKYPEVQIKVYNQDVWAGYQFSIDKSKKINNKNIALMGRFINYQYKDSPEIDIRKYFRSYNGLLFSAEYLEREFSVQRQIFQYNLPEDIPYGKSLALTGGMIFRSQKTIPYIGTKAAYARFTDWGYFGLRGEYGKFFNGDNPKTDAYRLDASYFSPLKDWKIGKVRHFLSATYLRGSDENNYSYKDKINLVSLQEFPVYNNYYIGTKKLLLSYQIQMFVNKTWKNFHFSPYFNTTLGWLGDSGTSILKSKVNSKFSLGVLINNPYLVFNRIQLSLVYYPHIPLENRSEFDFNGYRNSYMSVMAPALSIPHFVNFGN